MYGNDKSKRWLLKGNGQKPKGEDLEEKVKKDPACNGESIGMSTMTGTDEIQYCKLSGKKQPVDCPYLSDYKQKILVSKKLNRLRFRTYKLCYFK
jgi:hypothetical protein